MISDAGENSQKVRCFIGIAASDVGLEDGLVQQMALYRQRPGWEALRWTPAHFLHLTLAFLGNQAFSTLQALQQTLSACLQQQSPFALQVTRCSSFPDASSGIVAALADLSPDLVALQQCAVKAVQQAGIATETRPYRPHITLARVSKNATVYHVDEPLMLQGKVQAVSLYRSELLTEGSHYTVMARYPLSFAGMPTGGADLSG